MINLLDKSERPSWVVYPEEYLALVKEGKDEFLPWYLLDREPLLIRFKGMKKRYPARSLFPFARHDMCDDVACWEEGKSGMVFLIHDYASPGYEHRKEFNNFNEWYKYVTTQA